jgi:hypothetical protein
LGRIVAFSGIDGSGKTTVARLLIQRLKEAGIRADYHHELDFLFLRKLFYIATLFRGRRADHTLKVHLLRSVERNRPVTSEVYLILFWLDRLITHALFRARRSITILDRCQYDFLAQFEYRRYHNQFIRRMFTLLPRQDIIILFVVDPAVAFMRKRDQNDPDMRPLDYYVQTSKRMREIAIDFRYDGIVNTEVPLRLVVEQTMQIIRRKAVIRDKP